MGRPAKQEAVQKQEVDKVEVKKEVVEQPQFDQSAIMKMFADMQAQLASLKDENETLKKVNSNSNTTSDDYNQLVTIRNMFTGMALSLKLDEQGRTTTLEGFGVTLRKRLIEVLDICRLNKKFAELGYFIIEDKDIVEKYFPEMIPLYEKTLSRDELNNIGTLSDDDLVSSFTHSNFIYQRAIVDKFVTEWVKGEDLNYLSHSKINVLSKASGIDIMNMINSVMERENTKKEFAK